MTEDLTQAELDTIHAAIDACDLTEEEAEQLEREAAEGGGPLTDELMAAVKQALQEAARNSSPWLHRD
jgi:hypothetical protein